MNQEIQLIQSYFNRQKEEWKKRVKTLEETIRILETALGEQQEILIMDETKH